MLTLSTRRTEAFLANPTLSSSWATPGKRGVLLRQGGLRLFHYPLKTENLNKLFLFLERYLGYFSHLATVTKELTSGTIEEDAKVSVQTLKESHTKP